MNTKEFIEKYIEVKDDEISKREFLCQRKKEDYIPFETKVGVCETILNAVNHEKVADGVTVWHKRSAYEYVIFTLKLIELYTDVDVNDTIEDFNELNKLDLIDELMNMIPEKEFNEFQFVKALCNDDQQSNERNIMNVFNSLEQLVNAVTTAQATESIEQTT